MAKPLDAVVVGSALNTFGFIGYNTVQGLGLNTFGFLWPCDGIWAPSDQSITTTWVSAIGYSGSIEICTD